MRVEKANKGKKAFTLVELMVVMAIIAVLMGLAAFGIATALRVLRDNQRRDSVRNIAVALNAYYADNSRYPTTITLSTTAFTVATGYVVPLAGVAQATNNATPNANGTAYCYSTTTDGFRLGAKLETSTWFMMGSASTVTPCTDANIITPT
ncbi:MAG: type II secretion system protein [Candidatus Doudnabacteria bacterium]|nr:type II secretion system protein [Candidatus Doudnabacteria bacterium]